MTIRGRHFYDNDIQLIKRIVSNNPSLSRRGLSFRICEKLEWRQPNGRTKDRACRDALLKLQREGIIQLPQPKWHAENKGIRIRAVGFVEPSYKLSGTVGNYGEPQFEEVRTKTSILTGSEYKLSTKPLNSMAPSRLRECARVFMSVNRVPVPMILSFALG